MATGLLQLPGRGQKANTIELVIRITYHQYKYSLNALNNLNLRIQNACILADYYTNRRIEKTNENTRLTRGEYLIQRKKRKQVRAKNYRQLILQNRWTQAKLSRYLGISRVWVSRVLNAKIEFHIWRSVWNNHRAWLPQLFLKVLFPRNQAIIIISLKVTKMVINTI